MGLISYTHPDFWKGYKKLQPDIQRLADNKFELFKDNPHHPSLGFAMKGNVWTVDVGCHHRAIGYREGNEIVWFWIGTHEEYNTLMNRL